VLDEGAQRIHGVALVVLFVTAALLFALLDLGYDIVEYTVHRLLVNVSSARIYSHDL
jgi:hypothetical protein